MQETIETVSTEKLSQYGKSIFATMGELSALNKAVSLAQGFPDFNADERLLRSAYDYSLQGHNQYAPMPGVKPLRDALADKYKTLYGRSYNPDTEITITAGATQGVFTAITSVTKPGNEIIIFEPGFDNYKPAAELCGGTVVPVRLKAPEFHIEWDHVKSLVTDKTSCIVINSPNNPTGRVFTPEDIRQLTGLVEGTGIVIISDEVYEHMVFDGRQHISLASVPALADRTIVVSSFGKTYHITGWRVGYCLAPAKLSSVLRKVHQYMIFSSASAAYQLAIADFMQTNNNYETLRKFYEEKRDRLAGLIAGSRFNMHPAHASFFALLDYSAISDKKDLDFSLELVNNRQLAVIPLSAFYSSPVRSQLIRVCFAKKDETLVKAAEILSSL